MDDASSSQYRKKWFVTGIVLLIVSVVTLVVLPTVVSLKMISLESDVLYMVCGLAGGLLCLSIYLVWSNHKKSKYEY
jgi:bacteriorhodopsin